MQLADLGVKAPTMEEEVPVTPEITVPQIVAPRMAGVSYNPGFNSRDNRQLPWAGGAAMLRDAGKLLNTAKPSMRQALKAGGLDWTVDMVPLYAPNLGDGDPVCLAPKLGVQRSSDGAVIGVVGDRYSPVQNRALAEFTDLLVDSGGSSLAGMGEGYGGSKVYTVTKMDRELEIPGMPDEGIGGYLIAHNSHDGSTALTVTVVGIRWACTNGLISTVPGIAHTVKVRHTGNMEIKMVEANRIMAQATGYLNKLEALVPKMLSQPVSKLEASDMIEQMIPTPVANGENVKAIEAARRRQQDIYSTWNKSANLDDIRGTAWGFHQGVVEWDQWTSRSRGKRTLAPMERFMTSTQSPLVGRSLQLLGVG